MSEERRDPDEDLPKHEDEPPADEDGRDPEEEEEEECTSRAIRSDLRGGR